MSLYLDTGLRSSRDKNEPCLVIVPNNEHEAAHGVLLAIGDGINDRPAPESAARDALKALGDHYYAAPENWGLKHALQDSFAVANRALVTGSESGRAAAVSALVLRRRRWAIAHAGHTRVWLLRNNEVKLLTRDHVAPRVRRAPEVQRACGLDTSIETDFVSGEIAEGDIFVLTNQSTHNTITGAEILACAVADVPAMQMAAMIVDRAARSDANACACVVRVEQVPDESREDIEEDIAALPAIAPPAVNTVVDGFRIERLVHKSSRYRLYKAVDMQSGDIVALKFPNPKEAVDAGFAERFLREEWIGRRVSSAHLVRTLSLKKGRRTVLYSVMGYPSGESLAKRLARKGHLSLREVAFTGGQLLEALAQLHDQGVIHNDVRPQNIVIEAKSKDLMLLGLGSSHVTHTVDSETTSSSRRSTFLAPELFEHNAEPGVRSDVFSAGITLYRMLTGAYPYGKNSTGTAPRGRYTPITRHRQGLSEQLDAVLQRACALDPADRYESAQEFAEALEAASAVQETTVETKAEPKNGLVRQNWELATIATVVVLLLIYLVFFVKR